MSANNPNVVITRDLPIPWVRMADGLVIINAETLKKTEKKG